MHECDCHDYYVVGLLLNGDTRHMYTIYKQVYNILISTKLPAWWALWLLWWPLTDAAIFQCVYGHLKSIFFFLVLFHCCILLEIKLTTTTTKVMDTWINPYKSRVIKLHIIDTLLVKEIYSTQLELKPLLINPCDIGDFNLVLYLHCSLWYHIPYHHVKKC